MKIKAVICSFLVLALCSSVYALSSDDAMQEIQAEILTTFKNEVTPVLSSRELSPAIQLIEEIKKSEPNYDIIDMLLESRNLNINEKDSSGYTALMWTVALNKRDIFQKLFWKCNLNVQNTNGETALIMAINKDRREIIDDMFHNISEAKYKFLLRPFSVNLNIQDKKGYNALALAIDKNDQKTVAYLLDARDTDGKHLVALNPGDLKDKNYGSGNSPLIDSVRHSDGKIFEMLLDAKDDDGNYRADLNYTSRLGWTVLSMVSGQAPNYPSDYPFIEKILEAKDSNGNYRMTNLNSRYLPENPLFEAILSRNLTNVKLLTQAKDDDGKCRVDLDVTLNGAISHLHIEKGDTALDMAIKLQEEEIAQALLAAMIECKK